jgi:uncharacterized protein (TIGR02231 family)
MRYLIISAILFTAVSAGTMGAVEKEIKSEIKHVTLYPDRAQVTGDAPISLQAGETVLMLRGLSPYIIKSTIQVSGEGSFTIMGISHSNNFLATLTDSPEVKELKAKIEALTLKIGDERNAIAILGEKENFLTANRIITGKEAALTAEQYRAMLELYTTNIEQIRTTTLKRVRLISDYEKELADLNNQLNQISGKRRMPTGEIAVTVSAARAVTGKLNISYIVTNAGWTPSYDIRVDDINKPLTLVYLANIVQSTGNDWKGVKLSFTNANPSESGVIPVLNPWYLNYHEVRPMMAPSTVRIRGLNSQAPEMKKEMEVMEEAVFSMMDAAAPEVSISTGATTFSFDVEVPSDVMSDGQMKTMEIGRTSTQASFAYESVPKLDPKAFLTGKLDKWEELNIIGGEANLYFENTFVGNSYLSPAQYGDTMKVSLGSDKGITVKRERQTELTSRRFIGSNRVDTRSFKTTVRNTKGNAVTMKLTDQIPVSSNSDITVEGTELSGGKLNSTTGLVTWDFTLAAQQSREFIITYTVRYPKDKEIILE